MAKPISLSKAVDEYFEQDKVRQNRPSTQAQHRRTLNTLIEICGPQMPASKLEAKHVNAVLKFLATPATDDENEIRRRQGKRPRTGRTEYSLNVDRGALNKFVKFLYQTGYFAGRANPVAGVEYADREYEPGSEKRKPLKTPALMKLLDVAEARHPRDRMVIALAAFAGLRDSEITRITWNCVRWDDEDGPALVFKRPKQKDKLHKVPISPALERELRRWFSWYRERHPEMRGDWHICPARMRGHFGGDMEMKMNPDWPIVPANKAKSYLEQIKPYYELIGVTSLTGKGMHTLRRSFANNLFAHSKDMRVVQKALGHRSQKTTEEYMDFDQDYERVADAMASWDPAAQVAKPENVIEGPWGQRAV